MKSYQVRPSLLGLVLWCFVINAQAQDLPYRVTSFIPDMEGSFRPELETLTTYDQQDRRTYLLEFYWDDKLQKVLQRELWMEYENNGELSFIRVDAYDQQGILESSHFNWFDDQKRPTKDSTWNITDTLNPIYVFRYSYESNAAGQSLKETRELWLSSEPKWAKNREIIYTYDTNGCRTTQTICYSNKYETNCSTTQYQRNLDCTLQRETRPDITDILHTANADSSERNTLILNWDRPTQEWVARNYRTNYYDQWGYFAGSFNTNFPDSSQSEQIIINDSAGNILYSRQGEKTPGQAWQYSFEYELIEDSETYLSYRRYKQWDPDTEAFHNRVWYTTEKDPSSGIWKYQELDSSLVNGIWVESAYRSRIFHQYYCNDLLREYEEYLGWDDLTEPLEKETYGYQLEDIPCQGTPSPESLILYPNPTTDFLKFRSRDVLQMTGVRWQVVDLSGRVIQKGVLQLDDQAIVDVRGLAQGPYYLYVGERESRASYMFFRQ